MIHIEKKDWIKNYNLDSIENRIQLGFFRCPYCREWIGIYKDEFCADGSSYRGIHCSKSTCPFHNSAYLEKWSS